MELALPDGYLACNVWLSDLFANIFVTAKLSDGSGRKTFVAGYGKENIELKSDELKPVEGLPEDTYFTSIH